MLRCERLPLPPSNNHLYLNSPWGSGRILSTTARAAKNRLVEQISQVILEQNLSFDPSTPYGLSLLFCFDRVRPMKKTKHPFLRVDVDNRQKLIIDAIAAATGVDDRNLFEIRARKVERDAAISSVDKDDYVSFVLYSLSSDVTTEGNGTQWILHGTQE